MIDATGKTEADLVHEAQKAWDAGDPNLAADYVSALRGLIGERGATVEQTGEGKVVVVEKPA